MFRMAFILPITQRIIRTAPAIQSSCQRRLPRSRSDPRASAGTSRSRHAPKRKHEDEAILSALGAHLGSLNISHPALRIAGTGGTRTAYATRAIRSDEPLFEIPRKAITLSVSSRRDAPVPSLSTLHPLSRRFWRAARWHVRLAVRLLDELLAPGSPHAPYLAALPEHPGAALWAGRAHPGRLAAALAPLGLRSALLAQHAVAVEAHRLLLSGLPRRLHARVPLSRFLWAVSVVVSRAYALPNHNNRAQSPFSDLRSRETRERDKVAENYALIPGLDMLNHCGAAETTFRYDAEKDAFIMSSARPHVAGQEVFVSYGVKTNDELTLFYGFVEGGNPHNAIVVPAFRDWAFALSRRAGEDSASSVSDCKLAVLECLGLTSGEQSFSFRADGEDPDMMTVLRVMLAEGQDLERVSRAPMLARGPLSRRNEMAVWRAIATYCDRLLDMSPGVTTGERKRLARLYAASPRVHATWDWAQLLSSDKNCERCLAETVFINEREIVLDLTRRRVRQLSRDSEKYRTVCTRMKDGGTSAQSGWQKPKANQG